MNFSHFLTDESVVGVDIGSSMIKIIHAEPFKNELRIANTAICPTPAGAMKEGVVVEVQEVATAIKNCMRSAGIKAINGIAAVAGPGVLVRQVQFPTMSERALRKSIRFEASRYMSSSVEDSIVEFDILGPSAIEGQMNVVLAAAPRGMVDRKVTVLEQAGLDPIAIDIEDFATLRSLVDYSRDRFLSEGIVALLDMGASHSEINLVCKGNLELSRTIPIAGDHLTNAIKSAVAGNIEEAELSKLALDLTELVGLPAGSTGNADLRGVQSLIDELLREVRRSVNYYQSQFAEGTTDTTVETLIITGGTARMKGLAAYIQSRLNIDVRVGNPALAGLVNSGSEGRISEEDVPLLTVAFGLAVKETPIATVSALSAA